MWGIVREFSCNNGINRQKQLVASLIHDLLGKFDLVFFNQRLTDAHTLSSIESIGHAAADKNLISLRYQVFDHADLIGNLCTTQDSNEWVFRVVNGIA
ncbi:Uncharacterised protein [Mycobacteroides abscessus subsp. abscessus]|nr:Uncharacterised protein [Mycobacteroides abscessus subsp. abscessus]